MKMANPNSARTRQEANEILSRVGKERVIRDGAYSLRIAQQVLRFAVVVLSSPHSC
jgi:hypothetical protein